MNYIMMMIWNVSEIMFLDRDGDNAVIELLQAGVFKITLQLN